MNNGRKFWGNKPVSRLGGFTCESLRLENLNNISNFNSSTPAPLPNGVQWGVVQITDNESLTVICYFLHKFYQEKNNLKFTPDLLKFLLGETGQILTITNQKSNAICGVVCVEFKNLTVLNKTEQFAFPHFLCAHPVYRKKGIAEILMTELVRYVNVNKGIQQGCFLSKTQLFQQVSCVRKYQRPLNYNVLHDANFFVIENCETPSPIQTDEKRKKNKAVVHKKFAITDANVSENYVILESKHVDQVWTLYNNYIAQHNISYQYTKDEFKNIILNDMVKAYVIYDEEKKNIIDFTSYLALTYYGNDNKEISVGHVFLHTIIKESGDLMLNNLLKIMNNNGVDMAYASDNAGLNDTLIVETWDNDKCSDSESYEKFYENKFLKKQKSYLNLFNWDCPGLTPDKVNLFFI
jgi:hypothetical protein